MLDTLAGQVSVCVCVGGGGGGGLVSALVWERARALWLVWERRRGSRYIAIS